MTNQDRMQNLMEHLSFLSPEEQQIVSSYLDGRLSEKEGNEGLLLSPSFVKGFAQTLRASCGQENFSLTDALPVAYDAAFTQNSGNDPEGVIFSRPLAAEKAPEWIHSLENKEVKTLYGEKVVLENRRQPEESHEPEPIDVLNGLTEEEIQSAKEHTLEKTESYQDGEETAPKKYLLEEEDEEADASEEPGEEPTPEKQTREFPGLLRSAAKRFSKDQKPDKTVLILLSILISPLLLAVLGVGLAAYLAVCAGILFLASVLFLGMILAVTAGVVELVYGFLILFENVPAALIELGFGTMLVAVVITITALIYEFIFGIVPKWLRFLTAKCKSGAKLLMVYLYGGKA